MEEHYEVRSSEVDTVCFIDVPGLAEVGSSIKWANAVTTVLLAGQAVS